MFPRAYDLVVFDQVVSKHYCFQHFLLEVDRITRPGGFVVLGDAFGRLSDKLLAPLGWSPVKVPQATNEEGARGDVPLLMWRKPESLRSLPPPPPRSV